MSDTAKKSDDTWLEVGLNYAASWVGYVYGQRTQYFNHFLIADAFLLAAYVGAMGAHLYSLSALIGVIGGLISLVFRQIDARLREYAHAGEAPLKILQKRLADLLETESMRILESLDHPRPWYAHSILLGVVFACSAAGFTGAAVYALLQI